MTEEKSNNIKQIALLILPFVIILLGQLFLFHQNKNFAHILNEINFFFLPDNVCFWVGAGLILCSIVLFIRIYRNNNNPLTFDVEEINFLKSVSSDDKRSKFYFWFVLSIFAQVILFYILFIKDFYSHYLLLLWLFSIISGAFSIVYIYNSPLELKLLKPDKSDLFIIFILSITFLCFALPYLNIMPYNLYADESVIANAGIHLNTNMAYDFGFNGKKYFVEPVINLFGFSYFIGFPNLAFVPYALIFKLSGVSIFTLRLVSVITGLLTLVIFYFANKIAFNKYFSLFSSVILLSSHVYLFASRSGFTNIQSALCIVIVYLSVVMLLKTRHPLYIYMAGITSAFGFYIYFSARVAVPLMLLFGLYLLIRFWKDKKSILIWGIIYAYGAILILAPYAIQSIKQPELNNIRSKTVTILSNEGIKHLSSVYKTDNPIIMLANNVARTLLSFNYYKDKGDMYSGNRPFLDIISGSIFILGLFYVLLRPKNPVYMFLAISTIFITFLGWTLTVDVPSFKRLIMITPILSTIVTIAVYIFLDSIKNLISSNKAKSAFHRVLIYSLLVLIVLMNIDNLFINHYSNSLSSHYIYYKISSAGHIINKIKKNYTFYNVYNYNKLKNDGIPFHHILPVFDNPFRLVINESKRKIKTIPISDKFLPVRKKADRDVVFIMDEKQMNSNAKILFNHYGVSDITIVRDRHDIPMYAFYYVPKNIINKAIDNNHLYNNQ